MGQEVPKAKPKAESSSITGAKKAETVRVEVGPIRVVTTLKGVVEAAQMDEVSIKPEAWTMPLTIARAVEHGTAVKAGDLLVELDTEKIDQAIKDLRVERAQMELTLKHADEELPILEKFFPLDLAAAERAKVRADEDLAQFHETDRPLAELMADSQTRSARFMLEYAKDELAQLEKMYRDKDLTEETEQIILKRHRFRVQMSEIYVRFAEAQRDRAFQVELPRHEQNVREDVAKQALALKRAQSLLPLELNQKRLARDKLRHEREKNDERLAKLEADRKAMDVRSPADGIVYYGRASRGQWSTAAAIIPRMQKGGVLAPDEVFITIVRPRPGFIRATVEEKDLHRLRPQLEGKAALVGYPDRKLPARIMSVSAIPQTPGNFEARVDVDFGHDEVVMPGMACTVKFVSYRKDDALTVPATSVFAEEDDDDSHHVYVAREDGTPEKKAVKVGKSGGGRTEILDGLKAGDEILKSKP
jgi:multidrug efflux pump subunit AcrA (membrane-fusion protein)